MADGTHRECDQSTSDGGWTLVARVNSAYEWVCPSQGGSSCKSADAALIPRANLFHSSHWASSLALAPGSGEDSGASTEPSLVRTYRGPSSYDVRFSFYTSDDDTVAAEDGYATFQAAAGPNVLFRYA